MSISPEARGIAEHIAVRLSALRKSRRLRQADLVPVLGVQVSQISKYEKAESLITLDNLLRAATFFGVPIEDFLPGAHSNPRPAPHATPAGGVAEAAAPFEHGPEPILKDSVDLANSFLAIKDASLRASLLAHARTLAGAGL